jgi:DNA-directed RNA polymerase beta subunit
MSIKEKKWDIMKDYVRSEKGLVSHQVDSFNDYIYFGTESIVSESNIIIKRADGSVYKVISFDNVHFGTPFIIENIKSKLVSPDESRLRELNYRSQVFMNVTEKTYLPNKKPKKSKDEIDEEECFVEGDPDLTNKKRIMSHMCNILGQLKDSHEKISHERYGGKNPNGKTPIPESSKSTIISHKRVPLYLIPAMVRSAICSTTNNPEFLKRECKYDSGGYFIIKGKERVLVSQIRPGYNTPVVSESKLSNYTHCSEMRSMSEDTGHSMLIKCLYSESGCLAISVPYIKSVIPALVVFRAYGCESEKEIMDVIRPTTSSQMMCIQKMIETNPEMQTREDALMHISLMCTGATKKSYLYAADIIDVELFPHMGITATRKEKSYMLGYMVKSLLDVVFNVGGGCSKDDYSNKRFESAGVLMYDLTRALFKRFISSVVSQLEKKKSIPDLISVLKKNAANITSGIKYSFSTGNWGIPKGGGYVKVGVSQVLSRLSYNATISHLRRGTIQIGKEGKNTEIRRIHPSQFMFMCPCECLDPETEISMWNGSIKKAREISVGDVMINDLGNHTTVKSICSGDAMMYEVSQKNGDSYTVTSNHILTLQIDLHKTFKKSGMKTTFHFFDKRELAFRKKTFDNKNNAVEFSHTIDDDNTIDIQIQDYLKLTDSTRKRLFGYKCGGVNWEKKDVTLDPYILGMWLGDGLSDGKGFVSADQELTDVWIEWGKNNDGTIKHQKKYQYGICSTINQTNMDNKEPCIDARGRTRTFKRTELNPLKEHLKKYNLLKNKHIPLDYIVNDRETRLKVLAGFIDTDGSVRKQGHEIRISQGPANDHMIDELHRLAGSLGFCCHIRSGTNSWTHNGVKKYGTYREITITGGCLYEIPTKLPRKKLEQFTLERSIKRCKSSLRTPISVREKGIGPFCGFQLDGNQRFIGKDLTILHNSPEGQTSGIVLNLATVVNATTKIQTNLIRSILERSKYISLFREDIPNYSIVFLNGIPLGKTSNPEELVWEIREMREIGIIPYQVSVAYEKKLREVIIYCDASRLIRPVIPMRLLRERGQSFSEVLSTVSTWKEAVDQGIFVWRDVSELHSTTISFDEKDVEDQRFEYLEIDPSLMHGTMAATIPFSDHSQAPRNAYQSSMGKQGMGIPCTSYLNRTDTFAYVLEYNQRPIVSTNLADAIGCNDLTSGMNIVVAIAAYGGLTSC